LHYKGNRRKTKQNLDSEFKNNENFTGWNWVGLVMGGLLVLLGIMSMFLLEV
jgi:ribosomal protein S1